MNDLIDSLAGYQNVLILAGAASGLAGMACTVWAALALESNHEARRSGRLALVLTALGGGLLGAGGLSSQETGSALWVAVGVVVGAALTWSGLQENSWLRGIVFSLANPGRERDTLGSATFCLPSTFARLGKARPDGLALQGTYYGKTSRRAPARDFTRLTGGGPFEPKKAGLCLSLEDQARGMVFIGPPGTGKSQAGILPVAADSMRLGHSVVVVDPQGELTAPLLDFAMVTGHQVAIHDPTDPTSYHYNLSHGVRSVNDAQAIAQVLTSRGAGDEFWTSSAQNLMAACLLHYERLGDILLALSDAQALADTLSQHRETRALASMFIADVKVGGRMSTSVLATMLAGPLSSWAAPEVASSTDHSEFDAQTLVDTPTLLILKCPTAYRDVLGPYLGAVLRRLISDLEAMSGGGPLARPVKIVLDEFPTLGRLDSMVRNVNLFRKPRIGFTLAAQTLSQLDLIYGREGTSTLLTGLATRVVFGSCDEATASYVSRGLGRTTEREAAWRASDAPILRQRDLMSIDEVITPPRGNCTVIFRYASAAESGQAVMLAELTPMYQRADWQAAIGAAKAAGKEPWMMPRTTGSWLPRARKPQYEFDRGREGYERAS